MFSYTVTISQAIAALAKSVDKQPENLAILILVDGTQRLLPETSGRTFIDKEGMFWQKIIPVGNEVNEHNQSITPWGF